MKIIEAYFKFFPVLIYYGIYLKLFVMLITVQYCSGQYNIIIIILEMIKNNSSACFLLTKKSDKSFFHGIK